MSYSNYRYAGRGGFSRQPYYSSGYRFNSRAHYRDEAEGNDGRSYYGGGGRPRKHSGARASVISRGKRAGEKCVTGWNYSRGAGLVSFLASPYKDSRVVSSKVGRKWGTWILKITHKRTRTSEVKPCLYDMTTGKVVCEALGIVLNPATNYCGRYYRTKNR